MLSGREYHRHLSLFNPYSVLFQNLELFFSNDIFSLITQLMVTVGSQIPRDVIDYVQ